MLNRSLVPVLLACFATVLAGCVTPANTMPLDSAAATDADADAEPVILEWSGRITASELGALAHGGETEDLVAPVQAEGFGMELTAIPTAFRVDLEWSGGGAFSIMVDVPVEGGAASYATDAVDGGAACMMVPVDGLVTGPLAVMTHSQGAMNVDYAFTVTLVGGDGHVLDGGHAAAEPGEAEHEHGLPCEGTDAEAGGHGHA